MAGIAPVDLGEDARAVGLVIEVGEQEDGLGDSADLGQRSSKGAGATAALEGPQHSEARIGVAPSSVRFGARRPPGNTGSLATGGSFRVEL